MSNDKPAALTPQYYIDKLIERDYQVIITARRNECAVSIYNTNGTIFGIYRTPADQEFGTDYETTLARLARRVLNATNHEEAAA